MHAKLFAPTLTVSILLAMSACRNGAAESGQPEQHEATQSKQKRQPRSQHRVSARQWTRTQSE